MQIINVTETIESTDTDTSLLHDSLYQLILYNDEVHSTDFVAMCLIKVLKHNMQIAVKVMMEAHEKGKAVAEIEPREQAQLHKDQLQSYGLTVSIEKCE